ncbi:hypothetical protein D9611_005171 [Ephemerocybe angulata]|uniref:HAT C-terminal dimerisation domain-containing protein n=1 Tax=Ephemerocybe angulata TaxID=980116 RepID=A0A8H5FDH1_9AGAR|nr:hypothetical protein D9611_005171 [Tulosesus angulatus]
MQSSFLNFTPGPPMTPSHLPIPYGPMPTYHAPLGYHQWASMHPPQAQSFPSTPQPPQQFAFHNTHPSTYTQQYQEPPAFRIALADSTTTVLNTTVSDNATTPSATAGTKRQRNGTSGANKRRNNGTTDSASTGTSTTSAPIGIFGIGPALESPIAETALHPALNRLKNDVGSLLTEETESLAGASDIWYFIRGQKTNTNEVAPEGDKPGFERPNPKSYGYLRCRLCDVALQVWKNTNGQNKAIRRHLRKSHGRNWINAVIARKLKGWRTIRMKEHVTDTSTTRVREPFTLEGFLERLIRWLAVDDQSLDVVDCPELRDLLLYLNATLEESDLPHRTKVAQLVTESFAREYKNMVNDISNSLGRVAFTSDIWSRNNLQSYMAITAHYLVMSPAGNLELKSRLVAFRHIEGSHTGENIGKVFVRVLEEIRCLHKISTITLDNASNNNTAMDKIHEELERLKIPFDTVGNRIRCFPHIINLAVKAGLAQLTQLDFFDPEITGDEELELLAADLRYKQILNVDIIKKVRDLVRFIRDSGQRRDDFERVTKLGNEDKSHLDDEGTPLRLRVVGLLKDVDTRWSSTFLMIDRVLEMRPAIKKFFELDKYQYKAELNLSLEEYAILNDIRRFLQVFHATQELVSGEKTPTLPVVLPLYERLLKTLEDQKAHLPLLVPAITASQEKLREYLSMSRRTKAYAAAMVLSPVFKLEGLRENWPADDYEDAKKSVTEALLQYRTYLRKENLLPDPTSTSRPRPLVKAATAPNVSAHRLKSGYARLFAIARSYSEAPVPTRTAPTSSEESSETPAVADSSTPITTQPTAEELEQQQLEDDRKAAEDELKRWDEKGRMKDDDPEMEDFDILRFWQKNRSEFPLLWRLALDTLPMQASAVPCERAFSSSKETDALRRSSLSPCMMEMLQILKFIYRSDRLSFTDDLLGSEFEMAVLDINPNTMDRLLATGRIDELCQLVDEALVGWGRDVDLDGEDESDSS